jgi:hypothetical protein
MRWRGMDRGVQAKLYQLSTRVVESQRSNTLRSNLRRGTYTGRLFGYGGSKSHTEDQETPKDMFEDACVHGDV